MHKIEQLNRILDAIHPNIDKVKTKWIEMKWKKNRLNILNGYDYHPNAQSKVCYRPSPFFYMSKWLTHSDNGEKSLQSQNLLIFVCMRVCVYFLQSIQVLFIMIPVTSLFHHKNQHEFIFLLWILSLFCLCVCRPEACSNIRYN